MDVRYLTYPFHSDWEKIKSPAEDQIIAYNNLPKETQIVNLNKLAVLKVNGGLGTSMGPSLTVLSALSTHIT
jgi:UTP--glucose-1-phosphate uridylyltransferase